MSRLQGEGKGRQLPTRIIDAPKSNIASEETQYSFSSFSANDSEKTQYVGSLSQQPNVGALVDNGGRKYKLSLGVSTIGRKATTSIALVQIDTDDRTMSRNHAVIEVKAIGGQVVHILRNSANKNPSYINGTLIDGSDQFVLNNGDHIKMGMTELTFKK